MRRAYRPRHGFVPVLSQARRQLRLHRRHQRRPFVRERGVRLHQTGARPDLLVRVPPARHPAASHERDLTLGQLVHPGEDLGAGVHERLPREPAGFAPKLHRRDAVRSGDRGVADDDAVDSARRRGGDDVLDVGVGEVGGDLQEHRGLVRVRSRGRPRSFRRLVPGGEHPAQQALEVRLALQGSQPRGVGRRDVHDDVVGGVTHGAHAERVIVRRRRLGRELVLAQVDAHGRSPLGEPRRNAGALRRWRRVELALRRACVGAVRLEPRPRRFVSLGVEAVPIDHRAQFPKSEHPRLGVTGLRLGRDAADLDEPEAHGLQRGERLGVLVEPRRQTDRVREPQTPRVDRELGGIAPGLHGGDAARQEFDADVVRGLRVNQAHRRGEVLEELELRRAALLVVEEERVRARGRGGGAEQRGEPGRARVG
mmetsp:Transcript_7776/g.32008  ORF Transcript_7776/g.32008 Transcript_7776/m.32008 type:complete len:425 (+) Transcript_7776:1403-2677(+)